MGLLAKCVVPGCTGKKMKKEENHQENQENQDNLKNNAVFKFPRNVIHCAKWLKNIGVEQLATLPLSTLTEKFVCYKHFLPHEIQIRKNNKRCLINYPRYPVPSVFENNPTPLSDAVINKFLEQNECKRVGKRQNNEEFDHAYCSKKPRTANSSSAIGDSACSVSSNKIKETNKTLIMNNNDNIINNTNNYNYDNIVDLTDVELFNSGIDVSDDRISQNNNLQDVCDNSMEVLANNDLQSPNNHEVIIDEDSRPMITNVEGTIQNSDPTSNNSKVRLDVGREMLDLSLFGKLLEYPTINKVSLTHVSGSLHYKIIKQSDLAAYTDKLSLELKNMIMKTDAVTAMTLILNIEKVINKYKN